MKIIKKLKTFSLLTSVVIYALFMTGCASSPPQNIDNICDIFKEKKSWYEEAQDSQERWGSPIPVMMAFIRQESSFVADAKPARMKILWIIPGPRKTSAYGYPQAKDEVWEDYENATGNYSYDRDDFGDAVDFLGWYNTLSKKSNGINITDTKNLYLAYHEGQGGYRRKTYDSKPALIKIADKVVAQSQKYKQQLQGCESEL